MYSGSLNLTYLETSLRCSEFVYSYLIRDIKKDNTLGPLCKVNILSI